MAETDITEEWRPVVGFEGRYEVSDMGRVRSLAREWTQVTATGTPHVHRVKGKLLKPGRSMNHYWTVALGRGNSKTVHSLVAQAFIGPRPDRCEVRHKNGDRGDARAENLEYGTRHQNIMDAIRHGTWMSAGRKAHCEIMGPLLHTYRRDRA